MKLKANTRRRRGKPASFLSILTGKFGKSHRLPAHVTGENDWEVEVPQIQMSRAFAVMLVLFIVGVGGLFAFQMFGKEEKKPEQAAAPAASSNNNNAAPAPLEARETRPAVVMNSPAPAVPEIPDNIELPEPAPELPATAADTGEQRIYVWKSGDTLPLVAASFGVTSSAFRTANPDKPLIPGTEFIVPSAGRVIGSAEAPATSNTGATILDPLADRRIAEVTAPKAEVVEEEMTAEETPPPARITEQTTTKNVVSRTTPREEAKPAATTAKTKPAAKPATPKTSGQRAHVVAKGETVYNIARRHGVSAEELAKANGLDSNFTIRPGQQLKVPVRR